MDLLTKPWPWYIAGPLIGITVPILLIMGNKTLGVSSTLRQLGEACLPSSPQGYNWKKDSWNLFFVTGIVAGGFLAGVIVGDPHPVSISASTIQYLKSKGLDDPQGLIPRELFQWSSLATIKGFILIVVGGWLVGFGTQYAQGCTSGHGILGLSAFQWPSLVATASFFLGGILFSKFILPLILTL